MLKRSACYTHSAGRRPRGRCLAEMVPFGTAAKPPSAAFRRRWCVSPSWRVRNHSFGDRPSPVALTQILAIALARQKGVEGFWHGVLYNGRRIADCYSSLTFRRGRAPSLIAAVILRPGVFLYRSFCHRILFSQALLRSIPIPIGVLAHLVFKFAAKRRLIWKPGTPSPLSAGWKRQLLS